MAENFDDAPTGSAPFSGYSSSSTFTTMPSSSSIVVALGAVTPMRSMDGAADGNSRPSGISIHWRMRSSCGIT